MLPVCQREGVEEVVIAGDMFTTRAAQTLSTLLAVKAALTKAVSQGVYVTIGEGNHDKTDQEAIEGYNHLWSGLQGIEVVDVYKLITLSNNIHNSLKTTSSFISMKECMVR